MNKNTKKSPKDSAIRREAGTGKLLWEFMRGSKLYFLAGIIASLAVTGTDILNPQLIRFTVDSVIGGEPSSLPAYARVIVDALGGADAIRANLAIIAIAIMYDEEESLWMN